MITYLDAFVLSLIGLAVGTGISLLIYGLKKLICGTI